MWRWRESNPRPMGIVFLYFYEIRAILIILNVMNAQDDIYSFVLISGDKTTTSSSPYTLLSDGGRVHKVETLPH